MSWSPDGRYLASGGIDNVLSAWPNHIGEDLPPLYSLTHHQAAVKVTRVFWLGEGIRGSVWRPAGPRRPLPGWWLQQKCPQCLAKLYQRGSATAVFIDSPSSCCQGYWSVLLGSVRGSVCSSVGLYMANSWPGGMTMFSVSDCIILERMTHSLTTKRLSIR